MTADQEVDGHILHNLMLFGETLRRLGLDFGSGNMLDLVRATETIPIGRRQDFRAAARCLLVHRKQDFPLSTTPSRFFGGVRPTASALGTCAAWARNDVTAIPRLDLRFQGMRKVGTWWATLPRACPA